MDVSRSLCCSHPRGVLANRNSFLFTKFLFRACANLDTLFCGIHPSKAHAFKHLAVPTVLHALSAPVVGGCAQGTSEQHAVERFLISSIGLKMLRVGRRFDRAIPELQPAKGQHSAQQLGGQAVGLGPADLCCH